LLCNALDLQQVPDGNRIVIVGSGAAGLSLATRLSVLGHDILLLEAGGENQTPESQSFYSGEVANPDVHWPIDTYRVRALGGTSALWGGRAIPFDPIDFEKRNWVPHSGWPIGYNDLLPYYPAALEAAEGGKFDYTPSGEIVPGLDGELLHTTIERFSRPTNFWTRYGAQLTDAPNVQIVTGAAVTAIRLSADGASVDHLEVRLSDGRMWQVRGREYVIAAGGLETTRLLLASNDVCADGIGNQSGWLGRGYMCHLAATYGEAKFSGAPSTIGFGYENDDDGIYIRRRIALTDKAQRDLKLMNFTARVHIHDANDPKHGDPVLSLMFLAAFMVKYEYSRAAREADRSFVPYMRHVGNMARHPVAMFNFMRTWGVKRYFSSRRIPSIALPSRNNSFPLEFHCEQSPNWDSCVSLCAERDAYDMPRLRVDWRVTDLDFETVREAYRLMARELQRTGTGALTFDESRLQEIVLKAGAYGGHHSGTTRMASDPKDGVVDADCRVHGVGNLYIASSSVTPTSSQANPTLTIIALALRLADHLHKVVS
jgi:choline dehydrogenase-like flavoprotein